MAALLPDLLVVATRFPLGIICGVVVRRISCKNVLRSIFATPVGSSLTVRSLAALLAGTSLIRLWGIDAEVQPFFWALQVLAFSSGARIGEVLQPVGLTGGIACGKSTVASLLGRGGSAAIVDADGIAHDALIPGKRVGFLSAYEAVLSEFGERVLRDDGGASPPDDGGDGRPRIDRRKLGAVVFGDRSERRKLGAITHPVIWKAMVWSIIREGLWPTNGRTRFVCVDAPLLFETGMRHLFAIVLVVGCSPSVQLSRLRGRDADLTEDEVRARIASQMDVEKKRKMADLVVWNDGSVEELEGEVERAIAEIENRLGGALPFSTLALLVGSVRLIIAALNLPLIFLR